MHDEMILEAISRLRRNISEGRFALVASPWRGRTPDVRSSASCRIEVFGGAKPLTIHGSAAAAAGGLEGAKRANPLARPQLRSAENHTKSCRATL